MPRLFARALFSAALFAGACGAAYADRIAAPVARPLVPIAVAPEAVRSPYTVEIVADDGSTLDTFFHKGRYYVRGATNRAYTVRVSNPTPQRVEAVISIDGLDVIDGESGDLRKRGYIVPAYGEVRIEGWRTSLANVAAFRFSSVKGSYAGRKGKARNVGVVAVALFAEEAPAMIVQPPDDPYDDGDDDYDGYGDEVDTYLDRRWHGPRGGGGGDGGGGRAEGSRQTAPAADKAAAEPSARRPMPPPPHGGPGTVVTGGAINGGAAPTMEDESLSRDCCGQPDRQPERLGLGTEYGETRYSAASYTRFVRSSDKPVAVAELRYNDDAGLKALGILFAPEPDANEIMTRETADPFPGDRGFARPPAGIR